MSGISIICIISILQIILLSIALSKYYDSDIFTENEQKYEVNAKHSKYIGAIRLLEYDINKVDFNRATKLGAFSYILLLGLKYGLLFNLFTLISLIITIVSNTITNFKEKNFNLPEEKIKITENDKLHYAYTKKSQKIKCSICGNKFIDKTSKREVYVCDVEKSAWTMVGWGSRSEFYKYAEERCYVVDCPCGNHIAYYIIDEKDTKLPNEWSWEKDQYVEYRRTNYRYYTETKINENELSRLIDHTYNNIMREEIDSLDFIKFDYPCPMMYEDNLYPNILTIWEKFRYLKPDTSPLEEIVRVHKDRKLVLYLLELKFSIPRFKTMLIHSKLDIKVSMGLNGEYDHLIYQIQEKLL